ncbi:hypothetical protein C8F01DRAFT_997049 [Mycena amicta]|nr:hypothetical protein C8F01DRAFT_997049 [Mycena amicta]
MQFNILSAFILASVALGSVQAAAVNERASQSAGSTCVDWAIVPNTADVTANCKNDAGTQVPTRLSLGQCIGNRPFS